MSRVLRGESRLELSFLVENEVLTEIGVESHNKRTGAGRGCLTKTERDRVWLALPEWLQEKLMAEAIGNSEPCEEES